MPVLNKYLLVFKLSILDLIEYRFDFAMHTFKYATAIILMTMVWLAVEREGSLPFDRQSTVTYFFLAAMVYSLSNFHTFYIEDDIRLGQLSKYLLKPLSAFHYYLVSESASATLETILKIIVIIPILFLMGYGFTVSWTSALLFTLFLPVIFLFAFNQFALISGLAFWINEAWSIRWALTIIFRFLAGFFVPILFFPPLVRQVMFWLPYQHLAYTPIQVIQGQISLANGLVALGVLSAWTILLIGARWYVWRLGILKYESSGA